MKQDLVLQDARHLVGPLACEVEERRQDLLRLENLERHIYFEGNHPRLDAAYRDEIIATTLGSTICDVIADGPYGALKKNLRFLVEFWPNIKRTQINLRYRDLIVAKLDGFDAMVEGIAGILDRHVDPELWNAIMSERFVTLRQDLDELWRAYRRDWKSVGFRRN